MLYILHTIVQTYTSFFRELIRQTVCSLNLYSVPHRCMDFSVAALLQFVHIPKPCQTDPSASAAHRDTQETAG